MTNVWYENRGQPLRQPVGGLSMRPILLKQAMPVTIELQVRIR